MNKYNIKVGDYVETVDGGIGYVTEVFNEEFDWLVIMPRNISAATPRGMITTGCCDDTVYKRIGSIDFNQKENELRPIEQFNDINVVESICNKFNELIDHINEIQERMGNKDK